MTSDPMISVIPESAPFTPDQRQWLNGFLAGLRSLSLRGAGVAVAGTKPPPGKEEEPSGAPLLILYGSQSGNAEGLAHDLATRIRMRAGGAALRPRVL
jgi:sulfite reductase (NADPH) flavoprotein alpha-component